MGLLAFVTTSCDDPPNEVSDPATGHGAVLLDDLEDGDQFNEFGGYWFTYDDRNDDGTSRVAPPGFTQFRPSRCGPPQSDHCARITGVVTTDFQRGYLGMGTDLDRPNDPVDLRRFDGIEFWARGDGRQYRLKLRSIATRDYDDYGYTFAATDVWSQHIVGFDALAQEGWGEPVDRDDALAAVISVTWQTIGQPHSSVELAVDDIRFLEAD